MSDLCPTLPPEGVDLLQRMLAYEPGQRITAADALAHAYFDDIKRNGVVDHGMPMPPGVFENTQLYR